MTEISFEQVEEAQVTAAIKNFNRMRDGEGGPFLEHVGMFDDDGENHPKLVNFDNIDEMEAGFVRRFSGSYSGLFEAMGFPRPN